MQHDDAPGQAAAAKKAVTAGSKVQPVSTGVNGRSLWAPLRDVWLTNAVLRDKDDSAGAAYQWDPNKYGPVLQLNSEGEPRMLFAKGGA